MKTYRVRMLAALSAAMVAALCLNLAAPASAAENTDTLTLPDLTQAAGRTSAGSVAFQPGRGTDDATIQARIICAWMVEFPQSTNGDITTTARLLCSAPMQAIGMGVALFREGGNPPAETIENDRWAVALTADVSTPCLAGTWQAAMAVALVPPPGFFPRLSRGGAQSPEIPLGC